MPRHARILAPRPAQRGAATLFVTALLCLAALLVVAYASRDGVVEERAAANRLRSAQAFEAADAGLDWALAMLNANGRIGTDCRPTGAAGATSARERWLRFEGAESRVVPAEWSAGGVSTALHAACVRRDEDWSCSCPADGPTSLPAPAGDGTATAFDVSFAAGPRPGIVRAVVLGCTQHDAACAAPSGAAHDAAARVEASFALLPALRSAPAAALTVRGDFDAGLAAPGFDHADAASGSLGLHAGGNVTGPLIRFGVAPGSSLGGTLVATDANLAALEGGRLFARYFGMAPAAWARQPAAAHVDCASRCSAALAEAVAAGARMLVVDGDAALTGPATLGSPSAPIALAVSGACRIEGALALHGVLHCGSMRWNGAAAPAAFVRGAVVVAGDYSGDGAPDFIHDAAVLAQLQARTGSFVRINGSWKDF